MATQYFFMLTFLDRVSLLFFLIQSSKAGAFDESTVLGSGPILCTLHQHELNLFLHPGLCSVYKIDTCFLVYAYLRGNLKKHKKRWAVHQVKRARASDRAFNNLYGPLRDDSDKILNYWRKSVYLHLMSYL